MKKKIKIGVVGVGYLGEFHALKYTELPQAELIGVVDTDKDRADTIAAKCNTGAYYDHSELFNCVDAVSIAVPTKCHYVVAMDFLSRGIDVLLEKPVTETLEQVDELIEVAEKKGAVLQVGHLERFNAAVVALEGAIDRPIFIESHRLAPFKERSTDIDVILDLMIHDIDVILSLVGSEVERVESVGVPVISGRVDIANARIRFKNGCIADVTASRISQKEMRKIRVFQPNAYISIDYAHQKIAISKRIKEEGMDKPEISIEEIAIVKRDTLKAEMNAFIQSVILRETPVVTGHDGRRALKVALNIQKGTSEWQEIAKSYL
ncbi:MAG: Gfo/Idh/MocA family oxidoreductase [Thermodesulfobacteriota bacterium]